MIQQPDLESIHNRTIPIMIYPSQGSFLTHPGLTGNAPSEVREQTIPGIGSTGSRKNNAGCAERVDPMGREMAAGLAPELRIRGTP